MQGNTAICLFILWMWILKVLWLQCLIRRVLSASCIILMVRSVYEGWKPVTLYVKVTRIWTYLICVLYLWKLFFKYLEKRAVIWGFWGYEHYRRQQTSNFKVRQFYAKSPLAYVWALGTKNTIIIFCTLAINGDSFTTVNTLVTYNEPYVWILHWCCIGIYGIRMTVIIDTVKLQLKTRTYHNRIIKYVNFKFYSF